MRSYQARILFLLQSLNFWQDTGLCLNIIEEEGQRNKDLNPFLFRCLRKLLLGYSRSLCQKNHLAENFLIWCGNYWISLFPLNLQYLKKFGVELAIKLPNALALRIRERVEMEVRFFFFKYFTENKRGVVIHIP